MNEPKPETPAPAAEESSPWRMFFWPLMAILVISAFYLRDQFGGSDGTASPAIGKPLNRVQLLGLTDESAELSPADFEGRVTLLNFWGYWCPPCVAEMPELIKLRDEFQRDERFQLISVACHGVPSQPDVLKSSTLKFLETREYDLPVFTDPAGSTRLAVAQAHGEQWINYPTTVLVGPDKTIRAVWVGYSPAVIREQRREIAKALQAGS